jgi:hypothetical protein
MAQFCDNGFEARFTRSSVIITDANGATILTGPRDPANGLWKLPLADPAPPNPPLSLAPQHAANSVYELTKKRDIVRYLHQACCSPVSSTWIKAIDAGYFATWPGLTAELVRKHLPKSLATSKGHMRHERQGLRSTKPSVTPPHVTSTDSTPLEPPTRTNWVFMKPINVTGQIYSDQTGRFPTTSSRGNKYVMIVYDYDSNAILSETLTSRTEAELLRAYTKIHTYLCDRGLKPQLQRLDNEAPGKLRKFMTDHDVAFQLVPPHAHRRNAAEKAIATWKDHFVAALSTTDPAFPMHLWCRLTDQATTTLNLLRPSRLNPRLSAEAQLNGAFDFNKTPFAPPGTRILIHETPAARRTWAAHGVDGWYLNRAPDHYRCYRTYVTKTAAERISDTVDFFPHHCDMPTTSSADAARDAATALTHALQHPAPAAPFANVGDAQMTALSQLAAIFAHTTNAPNASPRVATAPSPRVSSPAAQPVVEPPTQPTQTQASPRVPTPSPPHHNYRLRSSVATHSANFAIFPPSPKSGHTINQLFPDPAEHEMNSVTDPVTGQVQEYRHLVQGPTRTQWVTGLANEFGRLCQGVGTRMPHGTETIVFIRKADVPNGRKVTYGRIVAQIRPQKTETHRVRLTVGGDRLEYAGSVSTPTAKLTTAKCLLNSTISTPQGRFMVVDIKDFYLNTPMKVFEYMRMHISVIPEEIINQYNLRELVDDAGWVYMEIQKGMYGLKQAGILANQRLTTHLAQYGYHPTPRTPGLWRHKTSNLTFSLVVDDFGVKYTNKADAEHLVQTLAALYTVSTDWTGTLYCGLTIDWNYADRHVDISMPGYVEAALHKFQHPPPIEPEYAPHAWNKPTYGAAIQYATPEDSTTQLPASERTRIQQIIGTLLYYGLAVDPTMLVALGTIAATQSSATVLTAQAVIQLLNYAATNPDAVIRYSASEMVLHIHSDGSYLSAPKARSRAGGHFFLSSNSADPQRAPVQQPPLNGPIHSTCLILRNVMASAAEAEVAAMFVNAQEAVPIRVTLEEMGHPQPPTPLQADNTTAIGFATKTIKQKRSKAMDMRFYWIQDRVRQGQFLVYWRPGRENKGDYHTKHHPPSHHRQVRPTYLHLIRRQALLRSARVC